MDATPFCDQINVSGDRITNPCLDDFAATSRLFLEGSIPGFCLDRTDRDGGLEVVGSDFGFAILGAEDSERGSFAFQLHDPHGESRLVNAEVYELPVSAFTRDREFVVAIASTYFETGELDKRSSWLLNIHTGGEMVYDVCIAGGEERTLEAFIEDFELAHKKAIAEQAEDTNPPPVRS